jgi:hypothetical protein
MAITCVTQNILLSAKLLRHISKHKNVMQSNILARKLSGVRAADFFITNEIEKAV